MLFTEPIIQNKDFLRLYRKGASRVHPILVTYAARNRLGRNRLGLTASKKVGCAVERNRCRRIIREAYRLSEHTYLSGYDIVVVARHRAVDADYHEIAQCLQKQMDKLGLIRKETTHEAADAVSDPVLPE